MKFYFSSGKNFNHSNDFNVNFLNISSQVCFVFSESFVRLFEGRDEPFPLEFQVDVAKVLHSPSDPDPERKE